MTEELLIKVELPNADQNAKSVEDLTRKIIELNEETDQLKKTNQELAKAGQKNTQEYVDNAKQIEINKQKINENNASRKGLIQVMQAEDNSIKGLRVQNAELIKQRDQLNTKTKEGQAAIQRINAQLDENNQAIRANSSSLEKQKINIGNYASALDGIIPGLGGFVNGIQSATKAGLAFIATPIGAVIAAVAAVLGTLSAAIKTDDEIADAFGKTWDQISAVFDVVLRRVGAVGKAIFELSTGNPKAAFEAAKDAVSGLGEEIRKAIQVSGDLADQTNELEDATANYELRAGQVENQIKKLVLQSRNATLSEKERMDLINEALALEQGRVNTLIDLKERQARIAIEALALEKNVLLDFSQTLEEQAQQLFDNGKVDTDQKKEIIKLIKERDDAQSASLVITEKLLNREDALQAKVLERLEKERQEQEKIYEQAKKLSDKQFAEDLDRIRKQEESKLAVKQEVTELEKENIKIEQEEREEVYIKDWKAYAENEKNKTRIKKLEEQNRLALVSSSLSLIKGIISENTLAYKALAISQATIDTYRAGNAVLAETKGGSIARIIGMIAVIAAGLGNVAKIVGVKFMRGGLLNGPSHAHGGIPFTVAGRAGFEAEGGEAIINKRSMADNSIRSFRGTPRQIASAINSINGNGVRFETGGIVSNETRIATNSAQNQFDANQIASLMNMVKVVLVREEYEVAQMRHDQTIQQATVR